MRVHFIQHVSFETPGYLLTWAESNKYSVSYSKVYETAHFPETNLFDLLIVLGGPMNIYEEGTYNWLKSEKYFIKKSIKDNKKVLGICLGAQLVADALGSKITPNYQKEIGWWPVKKTDYPQINSLTSHLPDEFMSFHWHGDTFDLPEGAIQLFSSNACHQQGFLHGQNTAALQFHLEVTSALICEMIKYEKEELKPSPFVQTEESIQNLTPLHIKIQEHYLTGFINNFLIM